MDEKYAIITGGNSGLGKIDWFSRKIFKTNIFSGLHLAKALHCKSDYRVVIACRDREKAEEAVKNIKESTAQSSIKSVHYFIVCFLMNVLLSSLFLSFSSTLQNWIPLEVLLTNWLLFARQDK